MRQKIATVPLVGTLFMLLVWGHAPAAGKTDPRLEILARAVVQGSPAEAGTAIESLRQEGPAGMDALLAIAGSGAEEAVDRVCGVRNCAEIRLFWYTDFEAAKAAARAAGKPILSLRLLGRLDEELSCANSRFFRTIYYNNREINELLRERFVLHWRSVRPVPQVTIDFGDGTRLERTLTGNSIHYVLDSRGRLVEVLPGLSGPDTFRNALQEAERATREAARLSDAALVFWATERHERQLEAHGQALLRDLEALSSATPVARPAELKAPPRIAAPAPQPQPALVSERAEEVFLETAEADVGATATARDPWAILQANPEMLAERINAASKSIYEAPMLRALRVVTNDQLRELARLRRPRVRLDPASRAFLLRKHGVTEAAKAERLVDSFEETVALDEVINEYRTGPEILRKLIDLEERSGLDLEVFNDRVYEEVFGTPLSDPWLGLAPEEIYVALPASTRTASSPPGH